MTTIRLEMVEQLRRALEQCPELVATEVTRSAALRKLRAELLAMRSKGYSVKAIADYLTERGLPVKPMTLRGYLSESDAREEPRGKKKGAKRTREGAAARQPKGARTVDGSVAARTDDEADGHPTSLGGAVDAQRANASPTVPSHGAATRGAATEPHGAQAPARVGDERQSGAVGKEQAATARAPDHGLCESGAAPRGKQVGTLPEGERAKGGSVPTPGAAPGAPAAKEATGERRSAFQPRADSDDI